LALDGDGINERAVPRDADYHIGQIGAGAKSIPAEYVILGSVPHKDEWRGVIIRQHVGKMPERSD
jgi:hypothetical protein